MSPKFKGSKFSADAFIDNYKIMQEYGKVLPTTLMSQETDDLKSMSSDDSEVQKIKQMGNGKNEMATYMYEGLPDPNLMPVKLMISNVPENLERPPAENFDGVLK